MKFFFVSENEASRNHTLVPHLNLPPHRYVAIMSDSDTSDDDDDVFLDLLERFPSSDEVLAAVRKHRTVRQFQIIAEKGLR